MRIIEPGPSSEEVEVTCDHCQSRLSVAIDEIRAYNDGEGIDRFSVICPACRMTVAIPGGNLTTLDRAQIAHRPTSD